MKNLIILSLLIISLFCAAQKEAVFKVSASKGISLSPNLDTLNGDKSYPFNIIGVVPSDSIKFSFHGRAVTATGIGISIRTRPASDIFKDTLVLFIKHLNGTREVFKKTFVVLPTAIFTFVEQNPEFPGGDANIIAILQKNIQYPQMERDNNIQGKVIVRFVVNEDGSVSDVRVIKSASPGLDKEAVRVVKKLPNFIPGRQQGKAVKVYFNLPVEFKLNDPVVKPAR